MEDIDDILGKFDREVDELTDRILSAYKLDGIELDRETIRLGARSRLSTIQGFMDLHRIGGLKAVYRAGFLYTGTERRYSVVIADNKYQKAISIFDVMETKEGTLLHLAGTSVSSKVKLSNGKIITLRFIESKDNIVTLE